MHYDIILHNGELHVCGSPVSLSEEEILEAFDLPGGVFIYGSDYSDDADRIKHDLENGIHDDDDLEQTYWIELTKQQEQ